MPKPGSEDGWTSTTGNVLMLRMMAGHRMPSITNPTPRRRPKWRHDMTMENLTGRRDSVA
jgi:hypothetical protein